MAMTMHPEIQRKAQEEIDRVVGNDRLPDFNDEPLLPYSTAVMRETLRWHQVAPFGTKVLPYLCSFAVFQQTSTAIPHCVMSDDVYNGYFIPAGSIVIGNSWYLCCSIASHHDRSQLTLMC